MSHSIYTFSIKELTKVSGLSRSTIMTLEKEGIIVPIEVNPATGYRYYDITSVTKLRNYKRLREYGMSRKEIKDYIKGQIPDEELIYDIDFKINHLKHFRDELEIKKSRKFHCMFSFEELPAVTCFCKEGVMNSVRDTEIFSWRLGEEMIRRGYEDYPSEPLFSIRRDTDKLNEDNVDEPFSVKVCIPVHPKYKGVSEDIELIPGTYAFTMLCYADYNNVARGYIRLWDEIKSRSLKPVGDARGIALVAPYTNLDLPDSEYVYRLAVPVEQDI